MKLLLASSNSLLVDTLGIRLANAGVHCEVRYRPSTKRFPAYRELWVGVDKELRWASGLLAMFCEVGRN